MDFEIFVVGVNQILNQFGSAIIKVGSWSPFLCIGFILEKIFFTHNTLNMMTWSHDYADLRMSTMVKLTTIIVQLSVQSL